MKTLIAIVLAVVAGGLVAYGVKRSLATRQGRAVYNRARQLADTAYAGVMVRPDGSPAAGLSGASGLAVSPGDRKTDTVQTTRAIDVVTSTTRPSYVTPLYGTTTRAGVVS